MMDLFFDINKLPLKPFAPGIRRFIFTLKQMMGAYFEIDPGVVVDEHSHPNEQMGMLIRGTIKWRIRRQRRLPPQLCGSQPIHRLLQSIQVFLQPALDRVFEVSQFIPSS